MDIWTDIVMDIGMDIGTEVPLTLIILNLLFRIIHLNKKQDRFRNPIISIFAWYPSFY